MSSNNNISNIVGEKGTTIVGVSITALLALAPIFAFAASEGNNSFGFKTNSVQGFSPGVVFLTGGGSYNPSTGFVNSAGGFRCIEAVEQGPLSGCGAGEGVRWDTVELLDSTPFKCFEAETAHTAVTSDKTVVLLADFYRAGDGEDESFTARMIVSEDDIDPDLSGTQNVWIEGVGCSESAEVNFS
jgi:hypothetical protein